MSPYQGERGRVAAKRGLSPAERARAKGALAFLRSQGIPCSYAVAGDDLRHLAPDEARVVVRDLMKVIVTNQRRESLPPWWCKVWERRGFLHCNLVYPSSPEIDARLRASPTFGRYFQGSAAIQPVTTWRDLGNYVTKDRGGDLAHVVGDRVGLSADLRERAILAGYVEPWTSVRANR